MSDASIGVFDSGMGGLTVMRALMRRLPHESFVYLGDTARLPYGTKSADTVRHYALQAAQVLASRRVKLIVIACNTASVSLDALQQKFAPLPVIGVIEPGAKAAIATAPQGPIAVLATEGTVKGGAYPRAITSFGSARVVQQACPLFVPLAEEGLTDGPIVEAVAHRYLDPIIHAHSRPRCLLLGCTHYPVLKKTIAAIAGPDIALVDSAETTAGAVAQMLSQNDLAATHKVAPHRFLVTDSPERFARVGEIFLGRPIDAADVELVDLQ